MRHSRDTYHQVISSLYTAPAVATALGISTRRVQALARSRGIGTTIGRDLIFTPYDLEALKPQRPGRPRTPAPARGSRADA